MKNLPPSYIELLCQFLNSADDKKENERCFNAYYLNVNEFLHVEINVLKGKYKLKGKNRIDDKIIDELISDTFAKVIDRLIRHQEIKNETEKSIKALSIGTRKDLILRNNLDNWLLQLSTWVEQISTFNPVFNITSADEATIEARKLNDDFVPLNENGLRLINRMYPIHMDDQKRSDLIRTINALFKKIVKKKKKLGIDEIEAILGLKIIEEMDIKLEEKGSIKLIESINIILKEASMLQIIFKKYLLDIVKNKLVDYLRKRNKKNANESSIQQYKSGYPELIHQDLLDQGLMDEGLIGSKSNCFLIDPKHKCDALYSIGKNPMTKMIESEKQKELEDFKISALSLLYKPVKDAEIAIKLSKTNQEKQRAEKKKEKEGELFNELCLIFEYQQREKYTQDRIAEEMDISRDKVRSRLEKIKARLEPLRLKEY